MTVSHVAEIRVSMHRVVKYLEPGDLPTFIAVKIGSIYILVWIGIFVSSGLREELHIRGFLILTKYWTDFWALNILALISVQSAKFD